MIKMKFDLSKLGIRAKASKLQTQKVGSAMVTSAEHVIIPEARANLKANKSIFEGTLFRSLSARVVGALGIYVVEVGTFGVDYGKNVEEGMRPGAPVKVTNKLIRWARIKLQASNPSMVARSVAAKIRTRGMKAKPFLRPAITAKRAAFVLDYTKRLMAVIK